MYADRSPWPRSILRPHRSRVRCREHRQRPHPVATPRPEEPRDRTAPVVPDDMCLLPPRLRRAAPDDVVGERFQGVRRATPRPAHPVSSRVDPGPAPAVRQPRAAQRRRRTPCRPAGSRAGRPPASPSSGPLSRTSKTRPSRVQEVSRVEVSRADAPGVPRGKPMQTDLRQLPGHDARRQVRAVPAGADGRWASPGSAAADRRGGGACPGGCAGARRRARRRRERSRSGAPDPRRVRSRAPPRTALRPVRPRATSGSRARSAGPSLLPYTPITGGPAPASSASSSASVDPVPRVQHHMRRRRPPPRAASGNPGPLRDVRVGGDHQAHVRPRDARPSCRPGCRPGR